jgi:hypothetical protein
MKKGKTISTADGRTLIPHLKQKDASTLKELTTERTLPRGQTVKSNISICGKRRFNSSAINDTLSFAPDGRFTFG